ELSAIAPRVAECASFVREAGAVFERFGYHEPMQRRRGERLWGGRATRGTIGVLGAIALLGMGFSCSPAADPSGEGGAGGGLETGGAAPGPGGGGASTSGGSGAGAEPATGATGGTLTGGADPGESSGGAQSGA